MIKDELNMDTYFVEAHNVILVKIDDNTSKNKVLRDWCGAGEPE